MTWVTFAPYGAVVVSLVLGLLGYRRANKSDQVTSYRDLLSDYRAEVDRQRNEIGQHSAEITRLRADYERRLADVEERTQRLITSYDTREQHLTNRLLESQRECAVLEHSRDQLNEMVTTLRAQITRLGSRPERSS